MVNVAPEEPGKIRLKLQMGATVLTGQTLTKTPAAVGWIGEVDGFLQLIDQTLLPGELKLIDCRDVHSTWEAIKMLRVRGAPAIGIAAAYGVCLATR